MGLRRDHVRVHWGSHVSLFVNSMKNDVYSSGHTVDGAWVLGCGIELGAIVTRYVSLLDAHGVPQDAPFFVPTVTGPGYFRHVPGTYHSFSSCVVKYLRLTFTDVEEGSWLDQTFSFHSLRRGGASHAHHRGVPLKLIMGHGLWRSKGGIAPYLVADFQQRLTVTSLM
eukprot:1140418-Rhodomonas_salina.1